MEYVKEDNTEKKKKQIKKLIINFFIVMLILTFFSNTMNNFFLPKVSASLPTSGSLTKEITGFGFVEAKESIPLYAEGSKRIEDVKVKVGDKVNKNQLLIVFKKEDIESQLKEENIKYTQMNLSLEKLKNERIYKQKDLERKVQVAKEKMDLEKENLDNIKKLFKGGYECKMNLDKQTIVYHDTKVAYEQLADDYDNGLKNGENSMKDAECSLQMQKVKLDKLNKDINASSSVILSPNEGVVTKINFEKGQTTYGDKPVVVINNVNKGFQFRMPVTKGNLKFLAIGDPIEVSIKASDIKNVKGTIEQIVESIDTKNERKEVDSENGIGEKKDLIIKIEDEGLVGGEAGNVLLNKNIGSYPMLVPNSAVNCDQNGKFLWVVKEREGALGKQFFLDRASVSVGQSDTANTVIQSGITMDDKVVTRIEEGKAVSKGGTIILEN